MSRAVLRALPFATLAADTLLSLRLLLLRPARS
jgi:hypothetical protein